MFFLFTVNLAQRNQSLLTEQADGLRACMKKVQQTHPFVVEAIVILPDHLHAIWTLPPEDHDYAKRWMLIKSGFSRMLPKQARHYFCESLFWASQPKQAAEITWQPLPSAAPIRPASVPLRHIFVNSMRLRSTPTNDSTPCREAFYFVYTYARAPFPRFSANERVNPSRVKKRERGIWQRRYWEHYIRDDNDFERHINYIHFNPVKHGYVSRPIDWRYSSIHRFINAGIIDSHWGRDINGETSMAYGER